MSDPVRTYLVERGCADFVVQGGLAWLVSAWERTVESLVRGEPQNEDEFLNDVDGRDVLEGAVSAAPERERAVWEARVELADSKVRARLVPTNECLWGSEVAAARGYSREREWWYYHRPSVVDDGWRTF